MITLPVFGVTDGQCNCGDIACSRQGKHPMVFNWRDGAPLVEGQNYGVVTGFVSGIVVIDQDSIEDLGYETLTIKTPHGFHYYFKHPGHSVRNSIKEFSPTCDIRGEGGYVVGPGSVGLSGPYEIFRDLPLAELPAWSGFAAFGKTEGLPVEPRDPDARILSLAEQKCKEHPARNKSDDGVPGQNLLFALCIFLVRRLELSDLLAFEAIDSYYNPRCQPQWKPKEIQHKLDDARNKLNDIPGYPSEQLEEIFNGPIKIKPTNGQPMDTTTMSSHGKLAPLNLADLCSMLRTSDEWQNIWRYDTFNRRIVVINPPIILGKEYSDVDITRMRLYFQHLGFKITEDDMYKAIDAVAAANPYHPVKEYLESVQGEAGAIERVAYQVLGVKKPVEVEMLRKWMVQAVRRIYEPGCQADHMLVLYGKQAAGKSSFGRILFGQWFSDQLPKRLDDKDVSTALRGHWCLEVAELASLRKSEIEDIKSFITRRVEKFRPAYGRLEVTEPRQCVLLGTTNLREILHDSTGSRRFWIIEVQDLMPRDLLEELRDAAWSEAKKLYLAGETQYFEDETQVEASRETYQEIDEWTSVVSNYVQGKKEIFGAASIYRSALMGDTKDLNNMTSKRINDILRRLGCKRGSRRVNGVVTSIWIVPEHLQEEAHRENGRA